MYTFEGTVLGILKSETIDQINGTVKRRKTLLLKDRVVHDTGYREIVERFNLPKSPKDQEEFLNLEPGERVEVYFQDNSFQDDKGRHVSYKVLIPPSQIEPPTAGSGS